MTRKTRLLTGINWGAFLLLYGLFSWWHGTFEGPLSKEEINDYSQKLQAIYPDGDFQTIKSFLENDHGGPVIMVNAIKLYDTPIEIGGKKMGNTSEEVLETYTNFVISFLLKRGSYPLFVGTALSQSMEVYGIEDAEDWSTGALMRYRSLRTMMEMITHPEFDKFHDNKIAAIEKTIAYPTRSHIQIGGLGFIVFFVLFTLTLTVQLFLNRAQSSR